VTELNGETIGERLRRFRLERGLSQRQISSRGVSNAYISRIEAGTRVPSVKAIRELAKKLGVTSDLLERGVDANPREEREVRALQAELALRLDNDAGTAERLLLPILEEAERDSDERATTRARLLLGLAACQRNDNERAIEFLLPLIAEERLNPIAYPELFRAAARCLSANGRQREAIESLKKALASAEKQVGPGSALAASFASDLALLLAQSGSDEEANQLLSRTLGQAEQLRDPNEQARIFTMQAQSAREEHDMRGELAALRRALASLEASENVHGLAQAHLLYAHMLTEAGKASDALVNVELATSYLFGGETETEGFRIRRERARAALSSGNPEEAIALARSALAITAVIDSIERGGAHWTLAEGLAATGQVAAAEIEVGKALSLLRSTDPRVASKLLRWWAKILRQSGRNDEAFAVLEEALLLS
jgi:transcriptional regulator with XRE-family HTH domain